MSFKYISNFSSGGHFVQQSRTILAILEEDIMGNIWFQLIKFGPGVKEMCLQTTHKQDGQS